MCGLDGEGAFNGVPPPVLFDRARNVITDKSWKLLYNWYVNISVQVRWNGLGKNINVLKGTRQGGLTSPLLFNLVYKDLIDELGSIDNDKYNVFCYADDILLASTTVSGLQHLINIADDHVSNFALKFNSVKTKCTLYGNNPFTVLPRLTMRGDELQIEDSIEYLGATVGNKYAESHIEKRIGSCRKAFYALQGAGLCKEGLSAEVAVHVFNSSCNSVLTYACETMTLSKACKNRLNKIQAKLIKCIVGLSPNYRTTPLFNALKVHPASDIIDMNNIRLLHNIMSNSSAARRFCLTLLRKQTSANTLLSRVREICVTKDLNIYKIISSEHYVKDVKQKVLKTIKDDCDGTVDTIRNLLKNKSNVNNSLLRLLLKAF